MYDKRTEFEKHIKNKLEEIRILCNRARIPFVFVAALYDDDEKTKYASYIDANDGDGRDMDGYAWNGLAPRTMGYEFTDKDNRIVQIAKIMNGEVAVPNGDKQRAKFEVIESMSSNLGDEFKSMYDLKDDGSINDDFSSDDDDDDMDLIEDEFDDE